MAEAINATMDRAHYGAVRLDLDISSRETDGHRSESCVRLARKADKPAGFCSWAIRCGTIPSSSG